MKLTWRGAEVGGRVNSATKIGLDQTAADCVAHSQNLAPVDTGWLRNNITFRPAIRQGSRHTVTWGNTDGPSYALVQELKHSYLRRSADALYKTLESRIKENL
jgi:hypothetical protein